MAFGLVVIVTIASLAMKLRRAESGSLEAGRQIGAPQTTAIGIEPEPDSRGTPSSRKAISSIDSPGDQVRSLELHDALFGFRVSGEVFCDDERLPPCIQPAGKFILPSVATEIATIKVYAHGYEPRLVDFPNEATTKVLLQPSRESTVTLHHPPGEKGAIAASITCPTEALEPMTLEGESDGAFAFYHAQPLLFRASTKGRSLEHIVLPGEHLDISFGGEFARLRVIDYQGTPLPGVPLRISSEAAGVVEAKYESDEEGLVWLHGALGRSPLWIRGDSRNWSLDGQEFQPPTLMLHGDRARLEAGAGETQSVCVRRTYNDIRIIDDSTNQPVTGEGSLFRRFDSRRGRIEGLFHSAPIIDGLWRIGYGNIRLKVPIHGVEEILRVAGYEAFTLPADRSFLIDRQDDFAPVRLVPSSEHSWLRITRNNRPLDIGPVQISEVGSRSHFAFTGEANKDGAYGPFRGGSVMEVRSWKLGGPEPLASDLSPASDGNYHFDLADRLGSIRILGRINENLDILALRTHDDYFLATVKDPEHQLFLDIPPGSYYVAPQMEATQYYLSRAKAGEARVVTVQAGKTSEVSADPAWAAERSRVVGKILLGPGLSPPALVPLAVAPLRVLRSSMLDLGFSADADGTYKLDYFGPAPVALLACDIRGGRYAIRAIFEPGGDFHLEERALRITRDDGDRSEYLVTFTRPPGSIQMLENEELHRTQVQILPNPAPITIPVHKSIDSLTIKHKSSKRTHEISIPSEGQPWEINLSAIFGEGD